MSYSPVEVCVWGTFACFTRPEMKVERVSYEVMTPSAARGSRVDLLETRIFLADSGNSRVKTDTLLLHLAQRGE